MIGEMKLSSQMCNFSESREGLLSGYVLPCANPCHAYPLPVLFLETATCFLPCVETFAVHHAFKQIKGCFKT